MTIVNTALQVNGVIVDATRLQTILNDIAAALRALNVVLSVSALAVGDSVTPPTRGIKIGPGFANPATAPLQLTAGTANTVPEAGAIEYNGFNLTFVRDVAREIVVTAGTITTEAVTADTTIQVTIAGHTYKLLAKA